MDLSQLSPEELEELKAALAEPPEDPITTLAGAIELMMSKLESLEEKVEGVCKVVYDDFIGGIHELASEKSKADRIGGLKSSYGSLFEPHKGYIEDHIGKPMDDLYPMLAEHLDGMKDSEGFDEKSEIEKLAKEIGERVAKLTGKPVEVEAMKEGEPAAPPVVATPEAPKEGPKEEPKKEEPKGEEKKPEGEKKDDGLENLKKHVQGLKARKNGEAA